MNEFLFFDLIGSFDRKGDRLNHIGVRLLALNRYISKYLNTPEPFPPTAEFIESVRNDIFPEQFPNYTPTLSDAGKPEIPVSLTIEDIKARLHDADFAVLADLSAKKKKVGIAALIGMAQHAFVFAKVCKDMAADLSDPPTAEQMNSNRQIMAENRTALAEMEHDIDDFIERANYLIGYRTRDIEELRKSKNKARLAKTLSSRSDASRKQQVIEIFFTLPHRSKLAEHPYSLAKKIKDRYVPKGPKDKTPHCDSIIKWLKAESII